MIDPVEDRVIRHAPDMMRMMVKVPPCLRAALPRLVGPRLFWDPLRVDDLRPRLPAEASLPWSTEPARPGASDDTMSGMVTPAMLNGEYGAVYKACAEKDAQLKVINDQINALERQKDLVMEEFAKKLKASAEARGVPFTAPLTGPIRIDDKPGDAKPGH